MARLQTGRLPPATKYREIPPWRHNRDTVEVRTLNAGWNALFTTALTDFSFKELAKEVGVSPPALYHYFPTVTALGARLAEIAISTLLTRLAEDLAETPPSTEAERKAIVREVIKQYLRFAEERPRHFALMLSPQFSDAERFPDNVATRKQLHHAMSGVLATALWRDVTEAETHLFWSLLHGSAELVASGHSPHVRQVTQALERYIEQLKASHP
jgi:AcrR family transcriptional regulator